MKSNPYEHGQKRCGRCKHLTRGLLHKVKAGKQILMEVCSRCYQELTGGGPLYPKGKA